MVCETLRWCFGLKFTKSVYLPLTEVAENTWHCLSATRHKLKPQTSDKAHVKGLKCLFVQECFVIPVLLFLKVLFICREERRRTTGHLHREELWQVWHRGAWTWTRHRLLAWAHATWPGQSCWYISRKHPAGYSNSLSDELQLGMTSRLINFLQEF